MLTRCVAGVRGDTMEEEIVDAKCELAESLSSHQYKTFIVDLLHKLWTNTQVQLGKWLSCFCCVKSIALRGHVGHHYIWF